MADPSRQHKNDIYGDISQRATNNPAIPAATVVLLRDRNDQSEVLMLRKNSKYAFGGMWVFPGGAIEAQDFEGNKTDSLSAATAAAKRETLEEANIELSGSEFHWFAHWTPPASTPKRFATWFFLAKAIESQQSVEIDNEEIKDHQWIAPSDALSRHKKGEIDLAPPTWVTLYHMAQHGGSDSILGHFKDREVRYYETHLAERSDGTRVAMWQGDAGYEDYDAELDTSTHRLVMHKSGFEFQHSAIDY